MDDKDPSQMTDEELDTILAGGEVQAPESEETPQEEETPVVEEVIEEQPEPADQPVEEEQEERKPSRRETLRVQSLLQKYGQPDERPQQRQEPSKAQGLNYSQELEADDEVVQRLEQDRQSFGDSRYNEGVALAEARTDYISWETSLKIDTPAVLQKFGILDKNNTEEFHPAVADALNSAYLKEVGFDPRTRTVKRTDLSYSDYVEAQMELAEEIANVRNERTVRNVARQTAQTGLRPDGGTAKRLDLNKPLSAMSDEELDAYGKQINLGTVKRNI